MNENLATMIDQTDKQSSDVMLDTDLSNDENNATEEHIEGTAAPVSQFDIGVTPFPDWFEQNHSNFNDIGHVRVSISDVDPRQDLIFKVPDPKGETLEGQPKKRLRLFEDADKIPVLDLQSQQMDVYKNNSFRIIYNLGSGKYIKSYGVKTGLINVFCVLINEILVPYSKMKMKKRNEGINIIEPNLTVIQNKLIEDADTESLQIQYKQIIKSIGDITSNESAVRWFILKAEEVNDVSHLLQLDDVMIHLVT